MQAALPNVAILPPRRVYFFAVSLKIIIYLTSGKRLLLKKKRLFALVCVTLELCPVRVCGLLVRGARARPTEPPHPQAPI